MNQVLAPLCELVSQVFQFLRPLPHLLYLHLQRGQVLHLLFLLPTQDGNPGEGRGGEGRGVKGGVVRRET